MLYSSDENDISRIKRIYDESFPLRERQNFNTLLRLRDEGKCRFLSSRDADGGLEAFIITLECGDLVLIDYFAVDGEKRSRGAGTKAIGEFLKAEKERNTRVFLEIEEVPDNADADDERRRRLMFYERNGFTLTGTRANVAGCDFELMAFGCSVSENDYIRVLENAFGRVMRSVIRIKRKQV